MSIYQPEPCCPPDGEGGESPTPRLDAETLLLCDILNGAVVGYALVVYRFNNVTGEYVNPLAYLDPVTGDPYVVQGQLQLCPSGGSGELAQEVSLSAPTLAALEQIVVSGQVSLDPATLAALEQVIISGQVSLDPATLAALEQTTVTVDNLPAAAEREVFGAGVTASRHNQVEVSFFEADPDSLTEIVTTATGGGSNSLHEGHGHFNTGTGANGAATAQSVDSVVYRPMHEIFAAFTAAFTTPTSALTYQRLGLYNATEGFFLGYVGTDFRVTRRSGGVDTHFMFNEDPLDGSPGSQFTRGGVPEAINLQVTNIFRIRFGWLGSASVTFEVMSPDCYWVVFCLLRYPNTDRHPSVRNPNLPIRLEVAKSGADATDLELSTGCWAAGTAADEGPLIEALSDRSLAKVVRSVLTAKKPSGEYVNIAANNQGRLLFALGSIGTPGQPAPTETNQIGGVDSGGVLRTLSVSAAGALSVVDGRGLTERMFDRAPQAGYSLWLDTADPVYIYIAEAPSADAAGAATFQGIRVTKDLSGNPLGKVQTASGFSWTGRAAAGWS